MKNDAINFGVIWTAPLSGVRKLLYFSTKTEALREAQQLYREGAQWISTFKVLEGNRSIEFNWRKF